MAGAVLLDVDGTLVDTNYLHVVAWFRAFRDAGETVPMWHIHRLVGMGADKLLDELVGGARPDLESGWSKHYDESKHLVTPLPGARNLVRALHERGLRIVLATSGQRDDVAHIREVLDLEEWIDAVVNSSEVDESKPARDIFALALHRAGVQPSEAVVVGDTVWDGHAARACGVRCIGVCSGGIHEQELRAAGALEVYVDAADLAARLAASVIATLQ
jgi:HAD superfamily hydrolase (TIGR01509 family)